MRSLKSLTTLSLTAAFAIAAVLAGAPAVAEDQDTQADENCIPLNRINNVEVLDRQHLLFRMTGRNHYLNTLPHACPSLRRHTPIMYRTSLNRLCSLDTVRVLENYGGGYYPGAGCGLGTFTPISDDEIKALKASLENQE